MHELFSITKLQYPILLVGKDENDKGMSICEDSTHLSVATRLSLQSRTLPGCHIFDSSGKVFRIREVLNKGRLNPIWKLDIINPMYKIELVLEFIGKLENVEDLKVRILKSIDIDEEYWNKNTDITRLKKKLHSAKSYKQVLKTIKAPPM